MLVMIFINGNTIIKQYTMCNNCKTVKISVRIMFYNLLLKHTTSSFRGPPEMQGYHMYSHLTTNTPTTCQCCCRLMLLLSPVFTMANRKIPQMKTATAIY